MKLEAQKETWCFIFLQTCSHHFLSYHFSHTGSGELILQWSLIFFSKRVTSILIGARGFIHHIWSLWNWHLLGGMFLAKDKWASFVKHASPNHRLPWLSNYIFKQQYKPFPKLKGLFKYLLPTYGIFILLAAAINNSGSSKLSVVCDLQRKSEAAEWGRWVQHPTSLLLSLSRVYYSENISCKRLVFKFVRKALYLHISK